MLWGAPSPLCYDSAERRRPRRGSRGSVPRTDPPSEREERLMTRTPLGQAVVTLAAVQSVAYRRGVPAAGDPGRLGPSARKAARPERGPGRGRARSRGARSSWAGVRRPRPGWPLAPDRLDAAQAPPPAKKAPPRKAAGHGGHRRGGAGGPFRCPDPSRRRRPRHRVRGRRTGRWPGPLERDGLLAGRPGQRVVRGAHQHRSSDHPPARPALRPRDPGSPRCPGARARRTPSTCWALSTRSPTPTASSRRCIRSSGETSPRRARRRRTRPGRRRAWRSTA